MWFKHRAWVPVAWLLCLGNLIFVWFAARPAEPGHATAHAVLAVLFGLGAQRLGLRKKPTADADVGESLPGLDAQSADPGRLPGVEGRLSELEERLDFTERALVDVRTRAQPPPKQ